VIVVSSDLMEVMGIRPHPGAVRRRLRGELSRDQADESNCCNWLCRANALTAWKLRGDYDDNPKRNPADRAQASGPATFLDDWVMLLAALGIFVLCALLIDNFLSPLNMRGLGLAISTTGIAACTMLYCLASGHFDLSVGSVIACAGVVAAV
jgi:hypothetical protein